MGIFVPGKDGDAMGDYSYAKPNRKQRAEYRKKKDLEEEREVALSYYKGQRVIMRNNEIRKKQRQAVGLE